MSVNIYNSSTQLLTPIAGATLYAEAPVGTILAYGGTTEPNGWFFCQGQALSRTTFIDLFEVIGTTFGSGDGSTTFNLPTVSDVTTNVPYIIKAIRQAIPYQKDSNVIVANAAYTAHSNNCTIAIDLDDGDYTIKLFTSEEGIIDKTTVYNAGSKELLVTFRIKPKENGSIWAEARKVTGSTSFEIVTSSNTYNANDLSCDIPINLNTGDYSVKVFCSSQNMPIKEVEYSSATTKLTVTFKTRPIINGTVYVEARKVR